MFRQCAQTFSAQYGSFHDNKTYLEFIDHLPGPRASWLLTEITIQGNARDARGRLMKETLDIWHRNPVEIVEDLISHATFDGHIAYAPEDARAQTTVQGQPGERPPTPLHPPSASNNQVVSDSPDSASRAEEVPNSLAGGEEPQLASQLEDADHSIEHGSGRRRWQDMRDARLGTGRPATSESGGDSEVTPAVVERVYEQMCDSEWWKEITDKLPSGITIAPVILASDKTNLSTFSGDKQAWPVYMTIGNIDNETRRQPSKGATVLLGYLPISKLLCFEEKDRQAQGYRLFHYAMDILLRPLVEAGETGKSMTSANVQVP
ncbi:hypothetical protein EVJ58_g10464 [Rhodofomes roseus]|uniref:Uncharacterized protein n=1 Tax=Rhodofomes roseus TaxID=34475 RepID=A0A4Y9XMT9_9APHY|nr:hypothetical protein EVJ58_g10464 [Rhodofomes roseus]